jgi:hypothetical protein
MKISEKTKLISQQILEYCKIYNKKEITINIVYSNIFFRTYHKTSMRMAFKYLEDEGLISRKQNDNNTSTNFYILK